MSDGPTPIGPILDELAVTVSLAPEERITQALVIAKTVNLDTGEVALMVEASDLDWIEQWGLHAAAGQAYMSTPPVHRDDEDV
jgi:hypothetical protein